MQTIMAAAMLALTVTKAGAEEPHTFNYTYSNLSRQRRDQLWSRFQRRMQSLSRELRLHLT
jgi:hypothetical protein